MCIYTYTYVYIYIYIYMYASPGRGPVPLRVTCPHAEGLLAARACRTFQPSVKGNSRGSQGRGFEHRST